MRKLKIDVGMYVRTKTKGIGKIISLTLCDDDECCFIEIAQNHRTGIRYHNITKVSYNIIDLIEEGDYVNGREVIDKFDCLLEFGNSDYYLRDDEIKSIVTKEQFESMKYRIGEENENNNTRL